MRKLRIRQYCSVQNASFDQDSWTTTFEMVQPKGADSCIVLKFENTQRSKGSPTNSGIMNLKVIRPGYPRNTKQIFTNELLTALKPFDHMRVMGWRGTNYNPFSYGNSNNQNWIEWNMRELPDDATQDSSIHLRQGTLGASWEYIILLANQLNKDIWINIPASASGMLPHDNNSYIYQLALLLKNGNNFTDHKGLAPNLNIYVEHSNEVWNYGFMQYAWNKNMAVTEVNKGGSNLNNDGSTDQEVWTRRRHIRRVLEIGQIFEAVFGSGTLNTKIRPIYAHWTIFPNQYDDTLQWVEKTYGSPSKYMWGLSQTHYFDDGKASSTASVNEVVQAILQSSDAGRSDTQQLNVIAKKYSLSQTSYESGPGFANLGDTKNLANRIEANRSPAMSDIIVHDIHDNWDALGGNAYNYFSLSGAYSRYGCWGATDDLTDLNTVKYQAVLKVINSNK